ncbi:hypothetical protein JCM8097_002805 [Rhodosporidiobolus ruineniae]
MCWSAATLFYGTFVEVVPLLIAADAWTRAKPVFLALDMISSRRKKGNLHLEPALAGSTSAADVPVEVWALVKQELVDLEMPGVQWELAAFPLPDGAFHDAEDEDWMDYFQDLPLSCQCAECWEPFAMSGGFLGGNHASDIEYEHGHDNGGEMHYFTKVDPSAFLLPEKTSLRFRHFLTLFNLHTYDLGEHRITPGHPSLARPDSAVDIDDVRKVLPKPKTKRFELEWHVGGWTTSCL